MANDKQSVSPTMDNELIRQFINNQKQELEIRKEAIEIQKVQLNYSHEYALEALKAQKEDRMDQRRHEQKTQNKNIWIILGIVCAGLLFIGYCLWIDKDEFLKEILKFLMYSIPFAGGGYFYGYNKAKKKEAEAYIQEE